MPKLLHWLGCDSRENIIGQGKGRGGGHCEIFSTDSSQFIVSVRLAS